MTNLSDVELEVTERLLQEPLEIQLPQAVTGIIIPN
jgi:hypothetical protein